MKEEDMNAVTAATASRLNAVHTLTLVSSVETHSRPPKMAAVPTHCGTCNLREVCLPCGLEHSAPALLDELTYTRKRVKRGETLYRSGSGFESLYAVRSGFLKSRVVLEDGRDQVTGFHMAGEIVGMDGIASEKHATDVIALEDSEVCVIPYA